jgi:hypothetical protein
MNEMKVMFVIDGGILRWARQFRSKLSIKNAAKKLGLTECGLREIEKSSALLNGYMIDSIARLYDVQVGVLFFSDVSKLLNR